MIIRHLNYRWHGLCLKALGMKRELLHLTKAVKFQAAAGAALTLAIVIVATLPDRSLSTQSQDRQVFFTQEDDNEPMLGSLSFWRRVQLHTRSFSQIAAFEQSPLKIRGERQFITKVSRNFFETVAPRFSIPGPSLNASRGLAYISHDYWLRHFGGRSDIVGQSLHCPRLSYCVAGVLDARSSLPVNNDIWVLMDERDLREGSSSARYQFVAQLEAGVTFAAAQAELSSVVDSAMESNAGEVVARAIRLTPVQPGRNFEALAFNEGETVTMAAR